MICSGLKLTQSHLIYMNYKQNKQAVRRNAPVMAMLLLSWLCIMHMGERMTGAVQVKVAYSRRSIIISREWDPLRRLQRLPHEPDRAVGSHPVTASLCNWLQKNWFPYRESSWWVPLKPKDLCATTSERGRDFAHVTRPHFPSPRNVRWMDDWMWMSRARSGKIWAP